MPRRFAIISFLVAFASISLAVPSSANPVLDQSADGFGSSDPNGPIGGPNIDAGQFALQTFTVGIAGLLHTIDIQAQQGVGGVPTGSLILTLRPTLPNGDPDRTMDLGSISLPVDSLSPFTNFNSGPFLSVDVSSLNVIVSPGDALAFELSSGTGTTDPYFVYHSQTDIYGDGKEFIFDPDDSSFFSVDRDLGFRTFVSELPPDSSVAPSDTSGLLAALRKKLRKLKKRLKNARSKNQVTKIKRLRKQIRKVKRQIQAL